ncbi:MULTISPECIES: lanthionine synthetase C family protein [unclassified Streptomyces]|uniref:lanthionine synthetase C family protein n=1 Tax=unclassified Streptomyces TaxID=2593676 RepID=UPI000DD880B2|nr:MULTISPECIES: lanthionine synthetase C family protein [unclassified Streptomyces]QZZ25288.1 lanthionine synthetase C family protein [Streptomyces sp. ST1015]
MPSPASTSTDREAAARIAAEIADRLTDPEQVAAVASAPDNLMRYPGDPQPVWHPQSLSDGHPALALLHTELHRPAAQTHAHLSAALAAGLRLRPQALYSGMTALAFAAQAAAGTYGGYTTLLAGLDRHIVDQARRRAHADLERLRAGRSVGAWTTYDVLAGTTGTGRYLLARDSESPALAEILDSLVAAATAENGWWITEGLDHGLPEHLNLGLAHGISGPLALLALAWRAGVRVERHAEAIERITALLTRWRTADGYWPHLITRAHLEGRELPACGRDSWCYGTAGTARAVHLAGLALGRADWCADALASLYGAVRAASDDRTVDSALCHGWAGLLQITLRMAHDSGDPGLPDLADALAARVIAGYTPEAPFGYRYTHHLAARPLDRPGLLEGAAGIALALHTYASGAVPATSWDGALLLA